MANPLVTNFDPKKVIIIFGGVPIDGYADGAFAELAASNADGFTRQVGADGEVMRVMSNDNTHTLTITLMQSSLSNQALSVIRNTDKLAGKSILPLSITDLNGGSLFTWPQAWIHGDPTWGFSKDGTERQWVLDTGQATATNFGGLLP
jgi:hypothetical protein